MRGVVALVQDLYPFDSVSASRLTGPGRPFQGPVVTHLDRADNPFLYKSYQGGFPPPVPTPAPSNEVGVRRVPVRLLPLPLRRNFGTTTLASNYSRHNINVKKLIHLLIFLQLIVNRLIY